MIFDAPDVTAFPQIPDGLSNTIVIVEANPVRAIPWPKPQDDDVDPWHPLDGLGAETLNGSNASMAGLADGSVRFISSGVDPEVGLKLLTIDGGEELPPGALDRYLESHSKMRIRRTGHFPSSRMKMNRPGVARVPING
jgi:hypothetical protein